MIAADIAEIEAAQRGFVAEAEAALQLTADTSRTTIPAKALWASAFQKEFCTARILASLNHQTTNCKLGCLGYLLQTQQSRTTRNQKWSGAWI